MLFNQSINNKTINAISVSVAKNNREKWGRILEFLRTLLFYVRKYTWKKSCSISRRIWKTRKYMGLVSIARTENNERHDAERNLIIAINFFLDVSPFGQTSANISPNLSYSLPLSLVQPLSRTFYRGTAASFRKQPSHCKNPRRPPQLTFASTSGVHVNRE